MKSKIMRIIVVLLITCTLFLPINTNAKTNNNHYSTFEVLTKQNETKLDSCESILGDVNDSESVAWLLQKLLNYIKILGPSIAVVLSSLDFAKAVVASDDENMKKTQARFRNRIIAAVLLFMIPHLVSILLNLFNITTDNATCGLR